MAAGDGVVEVWPGCGGALTPPSQGPCAACRSASPRPTLATPPARPILQVHPRDESVAMKRSSYDCSVAILYSTCGRTKQLLWLTAYAPPGGVSATPAGVASLSAQHRGHRMRAIT